MPSSEQQFPACPRCRRAVKPRQTQLERDGVPWHFGCERDQRIEDRKRQPEPSLLDPDPTSYPKAIRDCEWGNCDDKAQGIAGFTVDGRTVSYYAYLCKRHGERSRSENPVCLDWTEARHG